MSELRPRPALHFTARSGFTNDPHGIVHRDGVYHLFFQHNPVATAWSPRCHWGHATSTDLMTWQQHGSALSPQDDEVGCWSGSTVLDSAGPAILYTRIVGQPWGEGQVALARPSEGMSGWRRDPRASVISGPPPGYVEFRDPQVRRDGDTWRAVLGAGIDGVGGCALQYSSPDLVTWTLDGEVARRPSRHTEPVATGTVWECPQLLEVDGRWVLLISVFEQGVGLDVAYAIGDLEGPRFTAASWGTFSYGRVLYATTTFTDAEGRPTAMSWAREAAGQPPEGSPWAGAMSLPHVLGVRGDRLVVSQHPALDDALPARTPGPPAPGAPTVLDDLGATWRLRLPLPRPGEVRHIEVSDAGAARWSLHLDAASGALTMTAADGTSLLDMPVGTEPGTLDLVVDADICEVVSDAGSGIGSARVPAIRNARAMVS